MVITERYFPYPVLGGKAVAFRDDCLFDAKFFPASNSKKVVVEIVPELKEPNIERLIKAGGAKLVCHVECPSTAYRKVMDVPLEGSFKFSMPAGLVANTIQVNLAAVATEHLTDYTSDSFVGIYQGRKFDIDEGGMLAVVHTFSFVVETKDSRMADSSSPVQIVPSDKYDKTIHVEMEHDEIDVFLPTELAEIYKRYDDGKTVSAAGSRNHDLLVSIAIVPAMVEVLAKLARNELDEGQRDLSQYSDCKWFAPINRMVADFLKGENVNGDLFTIDFDDERFTPLQVAQALANNPLFAAFKRLEE